MLTSVISRPEDLRCREMQDHRAGDADADGEDGSSPPVRKNAEGGDHQASEQPELENACHHRDSHLHLAAQG
jgi:hypothetical protein